MSDTLIEQLNKITHGNFCNPMMVNMGDWNSMLDSVTEVLGQLEKSQSRVAELEHALIDLRRPWDLSQILGAETRRLVEQADSVIKAGSSDAFILRKQAEAVEESAQEMLEEWPEFDVAHQWLIVRSESLAQQADELE